jgi:hypothetical protein
MSGDWPPERRRAQARRAREQWARQMADPDFARAWAAEQGQARPHLSGQARRPKPKPKKPRHMRRWRARLKLTVGLRPERLNQQERARYDELRRCGLSKEDARAEARRYITPPPRAQECRST